MKVDPLASMRCWEIDVELNAEVFTIPALPAVDWWPVLASGSAASILDLIPSSEDLEEAILSGGIDAMTEALMDAVEQATGRTFYQASLLVAVANQSWPAVGGELARRGFRWDVQSIGAALDAVYSVMMDLISKEEDRTKFLAALDGEQSSEKTAAEFESMAGPRPTSGVTATAEQSGRQRTRTRTRPRPDPQADPSTAPTEPPGQPAQSDPAATTSDPSAEAAPASGTEPRPPRPARKPPRKRSAAPGSEPEPTP
jgi:hypothetical protein